MRKSRLAPFLLVLSGCVEPPEIGESVAAVTAGPRPQPLFTPDILWTDGATTINHAYISPTRASYDGRVAFESQSSAKSGPRCFRLIRPEILTGHISASTQALAAPAGERFCLPAATFHASTRAGLLSGQGAVCDAAPGQPPGRVDPRATNFQPQQCPSSKTADCYVITTVINYEANGGPPNEVWSRQFEVMVTNPKTPTAQIASVTPLGPAVKSEQGGTILEPVVSGDGRLLVYHDGRTIKYAVNPPGSGWAPCDARGFNAARTVADMFTDPNMAPYGLARFPLRDSENNPIAAGAEVGGAYPWIDRNASNLFITTGGDTLYYMNAAGVIQSRYPVLSVPVSGASPNPPTTIDEIQAIGSIGGRSGVMAMGLWTQGKMVVLDNRINNSDLAILGGDPPIHDRVIGLYTDAAGAPTGTRIGASNSFFINSIENAFAYDPDLRPITPRDVVWQVAATTGTDEVAFDDYLLKRALIVSPMNPSVNNTAAALHKRDYVDGFQQTGTSLGEGFTLTPHIQNAATSVRWNLPAFGSLLGGARVEPIAAGGVKGKGVWLDGTDDRIEYVVPAQTQTSDMTASPWMYAVWLNPTTALGATARRVLKTPDGSELLLTSTGVVLRKGGVSTTVAVPVALRPAPTRYTHLAVLSTPAGASTSLKVYLDGYLLQTVSVATSMLRMSAGTLTVGATTGQLGVIGWMDELKVIAQTPGAEELCNHAYGTLVGVTAGPGFAIAGNYPASSHTAVTAALGAGATYPRYYCESQIIAAADAAGYVCKTSRNDARCVGQRVQFPEGPLKHSVPRPNSASNAFCLGCHDNTNPSFTMKTAALALQPAIDLEDDRRRQPMQPTSLLFGLVPAGLFGPGLPAATLPAAPAGLEVDPFLLPAGP